jgi:hypothetical protein
MAERKSILLRLPPDLVEELNRWARDDLRSLNAQIEFVLRRAVQWQRQAMLGSDRQTAKMVKQLVDEHLLHKKEDSEQGRENEGRKESTDKG